MVAGKGGSVIRYQTFADGFCRQLEAFSIRGGRFRMIQFPSMMALLEHPDQGALLFDTGYTRRFFSATSKLPYALYRWITPVTLHEESTAKAFLKRRGIPPDSLKHVFLSHFHADHMGGLCDFKNATIHCTREGYDSVKDRTGFSALRHAYLPELLPSDFPSRARFLEGKTVPLDDTWRPFTEGWDLFGDRSLIAVSLPGHAIGQVGLAFQDHDGKPVFLVSDACWSREAFRQNLPPALLGWVPQAQRKAYRRTLESLHELHRRNPAITIIPTHADTP